MAKLPSDTLLARKMDQARVTLQYPVHVHAGAVLSHIHVLCTYRCQLFHSPAYAFDLGRV